MTPLRLGNLRNQPSTFEFQFIAAAKLYRYSLCIDDERIIEERLRHAVGNKNGLIYERIDTHGRVEIDAPGLRNESEKLRALVKVGSRHNQSFLATARSTLDSSDIGKTLTQVIDWLQDGWTPIGPETTPNLSIERLITDVEFPRCGGRRPPE